MKTGSALVPVIAACWLEGGQVSSCNQPVCGLDALDRHLELWSGEQFPMTVGALSCIQGSAFQQDTARPHKAVVTQHALQSVDMLPWPARSPYLSPLQHVWDIIGRQLQRHPQPTLTVPVLADQVQ
ncbi:hypothetical protein AVEN_167374-1 [Araneus ventricosus]|uniref:Tc1-like transposase DDE domain-containing protein n=1 Tax=Araneus ventricosus TaxID=182803 RepID=A0A4Y2LXH7_ARAVE|nr:hypothetical protein AVEN_167374-1 [Araneus ventricosus]